jgi:hypothetical protein
MTQMWLLLSLIALKHTQVTTLNTHNSLRSITAAPNACANIMVDAPQSLQHGEMGRAMFSAGGRTTPRLARTQTPGGPARVGLLGLQFSAGALLRDSSELISK